MIKVHQSDCDSFELKIQDQALNNLVEIAIESGIDPDDIIKCVLAGFLRKGHTNIILKGRANELEGKNGGLGRG